MKSDDQPAMDPDSSVPPDDAASSRLKLVSEVSDLAGEILRRRVVHCRLRASDYALSRDLLADLLESLEIYERILDVKLSIESSLGGTDGDW